MYIYILYHIYNIYIYILIHTDPKIDRTLNLQLFHRGFHISLSLYFLQLLDIICMYIYISIYIYIYIYIHIHIHIYIYVYYIHMYTHIVCIICTIDYTNSTYMERRQT